MEVISHRLTPGIKVGGIRSLIEVGTLLGALAHSVLYPRHSTPEAIPKYVSGRTSYIRV